MFILRLFTILSLLILGFAILAGCRKDVVIEPEPNPEVFDFEVIWAYNEGDQGAYYQFIDVIQDKIIYNAQASNKTLLEARNKTNGELVWKKSYLGACYKSENNGSIMLLNLDGGLSAIDASNGNQLWQYNEGYLHHFVIEGSKVYAFFGHRYGLSDSVTLYKFDIKTGAKVFIRTVTAAERSKEGLNMVSMSYWQHPNGDEIMFTRSFGSDFSVGPTDFFAINMSIPDSYYVSKTFMGSAYRPKTDDIVSGNVVYVNGIGHEYKYNLLSKEVENMEYSAQSNDNTMKRMLLHNNKLYISPSFDEGLIVRNTSDFSLYKEMARNEDDLGTEFGSGKTFRIVNNKLYNITENCLVIFDLNTHELHKKLVRGANWSGGEVGGFDNCIAIDPETNYIYFSWYSHTYCIKEI
jgi:hypothetical protein